MTNHENRGRSDAKMRHDQAQAEQEAHWTPQRVQEVVASLCAPFDAVHRGPGAEDAIRKAANKLTWEERHQLHTMMTVVCVAAEHYRAMTLGWGSPTLFGAAADQVEVMNLLCALDPPRLSIDVIDSISRQAGHIFGGWTALPAPLFKLLAARMDEQEAEAEAEAEADEQAEKESVA